MVKIGLDLSINSSALCINKSGKYILFNYTSEKENNKWIKLAKECVNFRFIKYEDKPSGYKDLEIYKLTKYNEVTNLIIKDILDNIDLKEEIFINIEGYSYSSGVNTSSIIDIVGYSTLLRYKLYNQITKNINIYSPKTIKLETCRKVYGIKDVIGKKGQKLKGEICENNQGVKAGNFKKPEMFLSFIDSKIETPITKLLNGKKDEILDMKTIPYNDIVDSIHICEL